MTQPTLYHPSYHDIEKGCAIIANRVLRDTLPHPTLIVGLARGGLIPGVILSHILEIPLVPVCYSAKGGRGEFKAYDNQLPELDSTNILFVDDIADSGHTMEEVVNHYFKQRKIVRSAVLYHKVGSVHEPTYSWKEIPANSDWIIFPWET